jgi:hypothetical protein
LPNAPLLEPALLSSVTATPLTCLPDSTPETVLDEPNVIGLGLAEIVSELGAGGLPRAGAATASAAMPPARIVRFK